MLRDRPRRRSVDRLPDVKSKIPSDEKRRQNKQRAKMKSEKGEEESEVAQVPRRKDLLLLPPLTHLRRRVCPVAYQARSWFCRREGRTYFYSMLLSVEVSTIRRASSEQDYLLTYCTKSKVFAEIIVLTFKMKLFSPIHKTYSTNTVSVKQ